MNQIISDNSPNSTDTDANTAVQTTSEISFNKKFDLSEFKEDAQCFLQDYICYFCKGVIYQAVLDSCGDVFCEDCILNHLNYNNECPITNQKIDNSLLRKNFFAINSHIVNKEIYCKNRSKGCGWEGMLKDLSSHIDQDCPKVVLQCQNKDCPSQFLRDEKKEHMETCPFRNIECEYCTAEVVQKDYEDHLIVCEFYPLLCFNNCNSTILRKDMQSHLNDVCENTIIECQFSQLGCEDRFLRKERKEHMNVLAKKHFYMITEFLSTEKFIRAETAVELNAIKEAFLSYKTFSQEEINIISNSLTAAKDELEEIKSSQVVNTSNAIEFSKNVKNDLLEIFKSDILLMNEKINQLTERNNMLEDGIVGKEQAIQLLKNQLEEMQANKVNDLTLFSDLIKRVEQLEAHKILLDDLRAKISNQDKNDTVCLSESNDDQENEKNGKFFFHNLISKKFFLFKIT